MAFCRVPRYRVPFCWVLWCRVPHAYQILAPADPKSETLNHRQPHFVYPARVLLSPLQLCHCWPPKQNLKINISLTFKFCITLILILRIVLHFTCIVYYKPCFAADNSPVYCFSTFLCLLNFLQIVVDPGLRLCRSSHLSCCLTPSQFHRIRFCRF